MAYVRGSFLDEFPLSVFTLMNAIQILSGGEKNATAELPIHILLTNNPYVKDEKKIENIRRFPNRYFEASMRYFPLDMGFFVP